jgi:hypothetical protein
MASKRTGKALESSQKRRMSHLDVHSKATRSSFELYPPLKTRQSIRLLKVDARGSEYDLSFDLFTTTIETARDCFHALSYTWGHPGDEELITINGHDFSVRRNLFGFLRRLRELQWSGMVWVDAICINQSDVLERNQQVQIMAKIYTAAREVFVWLGPGSETIDLLFDTCQDGRGFDSDGRIDGEYFGGDDLQGIRDLTRKPYWNRIWTVQELVLAKKVTLMCGNKAIEMTKIGRLVGRDVQAHAMFWVFTIEYDLVYNKKQSHPWTRKDWRKWRSISSFFWNYITSKREEERYLKNLIDTFGHMECQDKHDRIYGLLGLDTSSRYSRRKIKVNYDGPLPELFMETLTYCDNLNPINLSDALDLASFLELPLHASNEDRDASVTVWQPIVGIVGDDLIKMPCLGPWAQDFDSISEWFRTGNIVHCTVDAIPGAIDVSLGTAIFGTVHIKPGTSLYGLHTDLSCTKFRYRPQECDHLVLTLPAVGHGEARPTIGVHIYNSDKSLHNFTTSQTPDGEHLILVQWREVFEKHLSGATLGFTSDYSIISITLRLGALIDLLQAILDITGEWEEDYLD